MRQPVSLLVPGNLKDACAEGFLVLHLRPGIARKTVQQLRHAALAQRRAQIAWKQAPSSDQLLDPLLRHGTVRPGLFPRRHALFPLQIVLQQAFLTDRNALCETLPGVGRQVLLRPAKQHAAIVQSVLQLQKKRLCITARLVHLVDKEKDRDPVALQQLPQGHGMRLHPVCTTDDQDRAVEHLQRPLHLRREVHVPRRVEQHRLHPLPAKARLLGKDRDPPLPLLAVRVQIGVAVVYPAKSVYFSTGIEDTLRQRSLARIHVGKQSYDDPFLHPCTLYSCSLSYACT